MAEPITVKALQDASLDAKSLEEVVNGNDTKQVTTRLGENYPSVKKAIKTLFENGGLPATPFATKALMTASVLVDGDYAVVTDDSVLANNGLYQKEAGVWGKSKYDLLGTDDKSAKEAVKNYEQRSEGGRLSSLYITDEQVRNLPYTTVSTNNRIVKKPFSFDGTIEKIEFMLGEGFIVDKTFILDINILDVTPTGFRSAATYRITDELSANGAPSNNLYVVVPIWNGMNSLSVNIPIKKGQLLSMRVHLNKTIPSYYDAADPTEYPEVWISKTGKEDIRANQSVPLTDFISGTSVIGVNIKASANTTNQKYKDLKNQVLGSNLDSPFRYFNKSLTTRYRIYNDPAKQGGVISTVKFMAGSGTANEVKGNTESDTLIGFRLGIFKPLPNGKVVLDRHYEIRNDSQDSFEPMRNIIPNALQSIALNIPVEKGEYVGITPLADSILVQTTPYYQNGKGHTYTANYFRYTGNVVTLSEPIENQQTDGVSVVIDYQDVRDSNNADIVARVVNQDNYLLQAPHDVETRSAYWNMGHASQDATIIGDYILSGKDDFCYLHNLNDKKLERTIPQDIGHMGNIDYSPAHDYLSSVPLRHESYYIAEGRQQVKFIKNFSTHLESTNYNVADMDVISVYFDKGVGLEGVFTQKETSKFRHLYPHFVFDNAQKGLGYLFLTGSHSQRFVAAKVSLGMGASDLSLLPNGYGTFTTGVGANDFNGTSMLLGKWHSMSSGAYQGGCVFGGKLYISWSRPIAGAYEKTEPSAYQKNELLRFAFGEDGTMRIDKKYTSHTMDVDGREKTIEAESAFCDGTYIYNTSVGGYIYAYPLDYSTPMRGSATIVSDGEVTVVYPFACTSTPQIQVTPTNASGVGMYVSAKSATGFTVVGTDGATFDWSAPITQ